MIRIRSFQSRVFAVLLVMATVPAALALAVGAFALGEVGSTMGTLGPWDAVAESGRTLADEAVRSAPDDPAVAAAAEEHREALSRSLQRSRLWSLVSSRVRTLLPLVALLLTLFLGGLAFLAARWLSRSLARPIHELVGWTHRIARDEPLPAEMASAPTGTAGAATKAGTTGGAGLAGGTGTSGGDGATGREEGIREFAELRSALRSMAGELSEARRREVESARLRAWTEMARRVAHELKNPLTPMRMAATALARSDDADAAEPAGVLLKEIGRLDEMARTFSRFGRMPEGPPSGIDLGELARTLADQHDEASGGVPVRAVVEDDIPLLTGHYDVISRAALNLVVNAVEATAGGDGSWREATAGHGGPGEDATVEIVVARHGDDVRLLVRDRGPGIPDEIMDTIWLPDVTTKRRGTGLGLAMVWQAAESHGGRTVAVNRAGGGAEVGMILPLAGPAPGVGVDETPVRAPLEERTGAFSRSSPA